MKINLMFIGMILAFLIVLPSIQAVCVDECDWFSFECASDGHHLKFCMDANSDGCAEWSITQGSYYCEEGCMLYIPNHNNDPLNPFDAKPLSVCIDDYIEQGNELGCHDVCNNGESICVDYGGYSGIMHCEDHDGDGCLDYNNVNTPFVASPDEVCLWGCYDNEDVKKANCYIEPQTCDLTRKCTMANYTQCLNDGYYIMTCEYNDGCYEWSNLTNYCQYGCTQTALGARCLDIGEGQMAGLEPDVNTMFLYKYDDARNNSVWYDYGYYGFNMTGYNPDGNYLAGVKKYGSYAYNLSNFASQYHTLTGVGFPKTGALEFWFYYDSDGDEGDGAFVVTSPGSDSPLTVAWNGTAIYAYMGDFAVNWGYVIYHIDTRNAWHYILINWRDGYSLDLYYDGIIVDTDELNIDGNIGSVQFNAYKLLYIGGNADIYIDDLRFSSVNRQPNFDCIDDSGCAYDGELKCGGLNAEYSMTCGYDENGCLTTTFWTHCPFGCNRDIGACLPSPTIVSYCDDGDYTCHGEFSVKCEDRDGDGYYEWNYDSEEYCGNWGCNVRTGQCFTAYNECELGEEVCCGKGFPLQEDLNELYGGGSEGLTQVMGTHICQCADVNNDGYYEYDYGNPTPCEWGCSFDNDVDTGLHSAECMEIDNELTSARNFVEHATQSVDVATGNAMFRMLLAFLISGILFVLVTFYSGNNLLGAISFGTALILFTYGGWLPQVVYLLFVAIGGLIVAKMFMGVDHE